MVFVFVFVFLFGVWVGVLASVYIYAWMLVCVRMCAFVFDFVCTGLGESTLPATIKCGDVLQSCHA